jgi:hypothetical protein
MRQFDQFFPVPGTQFVMPETVEENKCLRKISGDADLESTSKIGCLLPVESPIEPRRQRVNRKERLGGAHRFSDEVSLGIPQLFIGSPSLDELADRFQHPKPHRSAFIIQPQQSRIEKSFQRIVDGFP